jgi:hypothetical protein
MNPPELGAVNTSKQEAIRKSVRRYYLNINVPVPTPPPPHPYNPTIQNNLEINSAIKYIIYASGT